ncbi:MAG TPA: SH3 domain-containing protein [Myxococcus sp.]|jgi:uncharacterized protein YraI|nr:SH3 domain-containing protein [Myxococcus sp.]
MIRKSLAAGWAALMLSLSACGVEDVEVPYENEELIGGHEEHDHAHRAPAADEGQVESLAISGSYAVGTTVVTTDALNLRTGPGTTYAIILTMPFGARASIAQSAPTNGFYKVTYGGSTGWASGTYLNLFRTVTVSGGPVVTHAQAFANTVCSATGACSPSTYSGHHPTQDRALDILASNAYGQYPTDNWYKGDRVSQVALSNWGTYKIWYIIWRQRINYNDGRGWLAMEDRGSITQNHYDHVHVSFNP